jgi:hypothetical protein
VTARLPSCPMELSWSLQTPRIRWPAIPQATGDRIRLGYVLRGVTLGARDRLAAALGSAVRQPLAADTEDLSVGGSATAEPPTKGYALEPVAVHAPVAGE